jgi:pseudaminic acid synthase
MTHTLSIGPISLSSKSDRVLIIAELSANHGHSLDVAVKTVQAAKRAGADAIKLQTYTPDTITIDCDNEYFQVNHGTSWDGTTLYELYKSAFTPWEWHEPLQRVAEDEGLLFFSTPFDPTAVDFLSSLKVPAFKVASFEINDLPLIEYIASQGKPVIISTGIASLKEVEQAVNACTRAGNKQIALLQCTSAYPAPIADANLRKIPHLAATFDCIVGLSDHTMGTTAPLGAVALGARIIEKHFILDRNAGGPDSTFSLEPGEFKAMVDGVRDLEQALGEATYTLSDQATRNKAFSRSLFVVRDIEEGEEFTTKNIRSIRPGYGLPPVEIAKFLGRKARHLLRKGTPLSWQHLAD